MIMKGKNRLFLGYVFKGENYQKTQGQIRDLGNKSKKGQRTTAGLQENVQ